MSLSRRHFVHLASLSLLAGAALPSALGQMEGEDETFSPERLATLNGFSKEDFEPYIAERFPISFGAQSLGKLTLIEVRDTSPSAAEPNSLRTLGSKGTAASTPGRALTGFALRFQGSGAQLPQETYTFSQGALGEFPLFLVPSAPGSTPPTYTAIFTRFATPA